MLALGALTILVLLAGPLGAQEVEVAPPADLRITVHPTGDLDVDFSVDIGVADADQITKGMSAIVPCDSEPIALSESDWYSAWTTCQGSFERNHFVTSGELDFTVLASALEAEGIRNIDFSIEHSNPPHVEVDPRWESSVTKKTGSPVQYQFWGMHLTPEAPRSSIRALEDYSRTLGSFKSASPSGFKVNRCRPPAGRNERRL